MNEFRGFPEEGVIFLRNLVENNDRDWFNENKSVYKNALEEPAKAFVSEMCARLAELSGEPMSGKIFRIYRDVRFSKDKTPYNTHLRIGFVGRGAKAKAVGASFYFSLEPDKIIFGSGCLQLTKEGLDLYRNAVLDEATGGALVEALKALTAAGLTTHEPELKKVPRGFDADHPRADLLKHKGVTIWRELAESKELSTPKFTDSALAQFKTMVPLYTWLRDLAA